MRPRYLTTNKSGHRDWIYSYKQEKTLIRGLKVLKDGNNNWWDVSKTPADLTSFEEIIDWDKVSAEHRVERDRLNTIIPRFDTYKTAHDVIVK